MQSQTESLVDGFGNLRIGHHRRSPSRSTELESAMGKLSIRERSRSRDREGGRGGKKISYKKKRSKNRSRRIK